MDKGSYKRKASTKTVRIAPNTNVRNIYYSRKNDGTYNRTINNYKSATKVKDGVSMMNRRFVPSPSLSKAVTNARNTGYKTGTNLSYSNTYKSPNRNETRKARRNIMNLKSMFGDKYANALYRLEMARNETTPLINNATRKFKDSRNALKQKYHTLFDKQLTELKMVVQKYEKNIDLAFKDGAIKYSEMLDKKAELNATFMKALEQVKIGLKENFSKNLESIQQSFDNVANTVANIRKRHMNKIYSK
jgi:hypothetical protein